MTDHYLPAGSTGPDRATVTPTSAGWTYSGLKVLDLTPATPRTIHTGEAETLVLPLSGTCTVIMEKETFPLTGRPTVFAGPTDFAYLPRDTTATLTTTAPATIALPNAICQAKLPPRHTPADAVQVELRGAGHCARQVNNFCTPETFEAEKLIACEVLTPAGNWSSYPPHKHDHQSPTESKLEEIYYYQIAPRPTHPGFAYQRVYSSSPTAPIDLLTEVHTDDIILIPHGWHGPSIATPGHDLYYLNVMAGPSPTRTWQITDDPAHTWIRQTWPTEPPDPRLPFHP